MTHRPHRGYEASRHSADRALVEYWVAGEDAAFAELLARYRGTVYAVAYTTLSDPERAETVVTETFGEARRTAANFLETAASVSGWLTHLARVRVARQSEAIPAGSSP
jgi:DNA-directed RNA polymerase specialized sigma24 family protein